jgi:hypothetical protein
MTVGTAYMASDSGADDAAALRDRVKQLEQTVAEQQATIDSLQPSTASRRGVLAALTGVAGAGALGAYSQRASAQAAGQVGTSSEPVDVEAWDLTVQNQLAADLDAGGNSLTNVGAVETERIGNAEYRASAFGSDGVAIQTALNKTAGATWSHVIVDEIDSPPYLVSNAPLTVPSKTVVEIRESVVLADNQDENIFQNVNYENDATDDQNIVFLGRGGRLDGNKANNGTKGGEPFSPGGYTNALAFAGVNTLRVDGIVAKDTHWHGVNTFACTDVLISNNEFTSPGGGGIHDHFRPTDEAVSSNFRTHQNTVIDGTTSGAGAAIRVAGFDRHSLNNDTVIDPNEVGITIYNGDVDTASEEMIINNPHVYGGSSAGSLQIISSSSSSGGYIRNVTVNGGTYHDAVNQSVQVLCRSSPISDVTIANPTINGDRFGVYVRTTGATINNVNLNGGTVEAAGDTLADGQGSVYVEADGGDINDVSISPDIVRAPAQRGVYVRELSGGIENVNVEVPNKLFSREFGVGFDGVADGSITNTTLVEDGSGATAAIRLQNVSGISIADNHADSWAKGVRIDSGTGTVVINNDLRDVTTALDDSGTGTITDPINQDKTNDYNIT